MSKPLSIEDPETPTYYANDSSRIQAVDYGTSKPADIQAELSPLPMSLNTQMIDKINQLIKAQDYDDDYLCPTSFACKTAVALINRAGIAAGSMPDGHVLPDGDGGIRIEWSRGLKSLFLNVHRNEEQGNRLFFKSDVKHYKEVTQAKSSDLSYYLTQLSMNR